MELINTSFVSLMTIVKQVNNEFWRDKAGGSVFYGPFTKLGASYLHQKKFLMNFLCQHQYPLYRGWVLVKNKGAKCSEPSRSCTDLGGREKQRKEGKTGRRGSWRG